MEGLRKKLGVKDLLKVIDQKPSLLLQLFDEDESPVTFKTYGQTIHLVANPALIKYIQTHQSIYRRTKVPPPSEEILGKKNLFLLPSDSEVWKKDRAALQSFFQPNELKDYIPKMVNITTKKIDML